MKKILFILSCSLFYTISLFSSSVEVVSFTGKVKVKFPGDSRWSRLSVGDTLPPKAIVSTGFNSKIVLDLGSATLDVLPLTRMTVSEITESNDTISTSLFLQGGKIKADVNKVEGKIHDFKIKSPVATASVRGTSFLFSGNTLFVERGVVDFGATTSYTPDEAGITEPVEGVLGGTSKVVTVKAGGLTRMGSITDTPILPAIAVKEAVTVSASTKPEVIKDSVREVLGGDLVPLAIPTLGDIEQVIVNTALVTIEVPVITE